MLLLVSSRSCSLYSSDLLGLHRGSELAPTEIRVCQNMGEQTNCLRPDNQPHQNIDHTSFHPHIPLTYSCHLLHHLTSTAELTLLNDLDERFCHCSNGINVIVPTNPLTVRQHPPSIAQTVPLQPIWLPASSSKDWPLPTCCYSLATCRWILFPTVAHKTYPSTLQTSLQSKRLIDRLFPFIHSQSIVSVYKLPNRSFLFITAQSIVHHLSPLLKSNQRLFISLSSPWSMTINWYDWLVLYLLDSHRPTIRAVTCWVIELWLILFHL